ncbi:hypothetical protein V498_00156 [Pseudogymnoascus sp. VKM F-4517 (FW-2822)]|nr:hypothetical protein V498_00156 [Pseudogymnoascus sp. VKM F-4517 (FW-2822)]
MGGVPLERKKAIEMAAQEQGTGLPAASTKEALLQLQQQDEDRWAPTKEGADLRPELACHESGAPGHASRRPVCRPLRVRANPGATPAEVLLAGDATRREEPSPNVRGVPTNEDEEALAVQRAHAVPTTNHAVEGTNNGLHRRAAAKSFPRPGVRLHPGGHRPLHQDGPLHSRLRDAYRYHLGPGPAVHQRVLGELHVLPKGAATTQYRVPTLDRRLDRATKPDPRAIPPVLLRLRPGRLGRQIGPRGVLVQQLDPQDNGPLAVLPPVQLPTHNRYVPRRHQTTRRLGDGPGRSTLEGTGRATRHPR